ncbi:hypothetical protein Esti_000780 [Eimeria stiedai]
MLRIFGCARFVLDQLASQTTELAEALEPQETGQAICAWTVAAASITSALAVSLGQACVPKALDGLVKPAARVAATQQAAALYPPLFMQAYELRVKIPVFFSSSLWKVPTSPIRIQHHSSKASSPSALFACRPKPKKEKAHRNYRLAEQQRERREERSAARRQQLEAVRARKQLLSPAEVPRNPASNHASSTPLGSVQVSLFEATESSAASANEAAGAQLSMLQRHQATRINYRLVGGTWRRAKGRHKYVRLSGAQIAAAIFQGLPEEEVAAAIARAKRQDEGHMDLEAYEDSESRLPTLEGLG